VTVREIVVAVLVCVAALRADPARGQSVSRAGRFEIAIGPRWTGGQTLGSGDANETTSGGMGFRIFTASTTLAGAPSVDARLGMRITRQLEAQASGSYGSPQLRVNVSNDVENAAAVVPAARVQQFTVRGGVLWYLSRLARPRLAPFAAADAGYLREVHEGHTLVETGRLIEIGGGVKCLVGSYGRFKAIGARFDARAVLRSKGVAFDDSLHAAPSLDVSVYLRF
jgi:hypothetical protein